MSKITNYAKGKIYEEIAVKYLKKNKFKVIERNYKCLIGEIDIIATKRKVYHIIEVKFRQNDDFGLPREAVNSEKQRKIKRTTEHYFMCRYMDISEYEICFDVIEILNDKITMIEHAFI